MTEHYTKNTEHGVLKWCNRCAKLTKHYVWSGRIGACMEHKSQKETKKQEAKRKKEEDERINPKLF